MEKATFKPEVLDALKKVPGVTDEIATEMAEQILVGKGFAANRVAELDAQIDQLQGDRAYWAGKLAGYESALSATSDVKVMLPIIEEAEEAATLEG